MEPTTIIILIIITIIIVIAIILGYRDYKREHQDDKICKLISTKSYKFNTKYKLIPLTLVESKNDNKYLTIQDNGSVTLSNTGTDFTITEVNSDGILADIKGNAILSNVFSPYGTLANFAVNQGSSLVIQKYNSAVTAFNLYNTAAFIYYDPKDSNIKVSGSQNGPQGFAGTPTIQFVLESIIC